MMSYSSLAEVLRRSALGDSVSKISVALDIPESTLRDWLEFAKQNKLDYETLSSLTPRDFAELRAKNTRPTSRTVQPDWEDVLVQSQKPGVTVQQLYEAYLQQEPNSPHMRRSSFYENLRRIGKSASPQTKRLCLHNQFRPSEVAMIDYSGDGLIGHDTKGKAFKGQVFVGVLGHSGYIFAWVTSAQTREDWLQSISEMFKFYGGTTEELWLDNSTSLVKKADRRDPVLSPEFLNFCRHYQTTPIAVAPGRPTYKGLVENAVKQVQQFVLKPLASRQFFSIREMNDAVARQLKTLNERPMTTKGGLSRSYRFEIEEQKFLKKLPFIAFNLNLRIVERTVLIGDQIRIDDLRYAVPWGHVGQRLLVCIDAHAGKADLYLKDTREFLRTLTLRTVLQGDEPTQVDLLPEELRPCALNREQLVDHVKSLYGETAHKLATVFARHSNSMARKQSLGLLSIAKRLDAADVELACETTLNRSTVTFSTFKKVVERLQSDKEKPRTVMQEEGGCMPLPKTKPSDVRGPKYYEDDGESHEK